MTDTSPAAGKPSSNMSLLEAVKFYRRYFCDRSIYALAENVDVVYKLSQENRTARVIRTAYRINGGVVCSCPALIDRCRHIQMAHGEWDWAKCDPVPEFRMFLFVRDMLKDHGVTVAAMEPDMYADHEFVDVSVPVVVSGIRALVGRGRDSLDRIFGLKISFQI